MAAWKRQRPNAGTPEAPPAATHWTHPLDLLLEIVARSDIRTLVRSAAACKLLRRDIISPPFICRVTQQGGIVPPCILAYLNTHHDDEVQLPPPLPLSLLHPATTAAASFLNANLSPSVSRFAGHLLGEFNHVTSRGGLVLFHRRRVSNTFPNLCVYDLITGQHTFLSNPPGTNRNRCFDKCFLLTAADGIGFYFSLVVANFEGKHRCNNTSTIQVHTGTSTCGTWAPAVTIQGSDRFVLRRWHAMCSDTVVLHGGVIHWLVRSLGEIVTYNVCTKEQKMIMLPLHVTNFKGELYLGSYYSNYGRKLLRLLGVDGFKIFMWDQLPSGYWESEAVMIDMEEKLRSSIDTDNGTGQPLRSMIKYIGERSNTVLLHLNLYRSGKRSTLPYVLDLETKVMYVEQYSTPEPVLLEVDLASRLRAMQIFP